MADDDKFIEIVKRQPEQVHTSQNLTTGNTTDAIKLISAYMMEGSIDPIEKATKALLAFHRLNGDGKKD